MKKYISGGKRRGKWLIVLGAALTIFSLAMLWRVEELAQYITRAPDESAQMQQDPGGEGETEQTPTRSALRSLMDAWDKSREELGETASGMSALIYGAYMQSSGAQSAEATLTCVGEGWFDVYPRFLTEGRLFSRDEYEAGKNVVVLDEQLAFKLFPTTSAIDGRVQLEGEWYDVVGVVRHRRLPGDMDEYGAYIPLLSAARRSLQTDYVKLDCRANSMSEVRALENVASEVMGGGGDMYYTAKEVMRATMIIRVVAIIMALYLLGYLLKIWNRRTVKLIQGWQQEVLRRYFKTMLPSVIGWSALQIAGYALLVLMAFAVLRLTIAPMYMFTEWIPEVIVEWSKIVERFEGLMISAAAPVRYQTREYAAIRFYGALLRWGVICILCGLVLFKRWGFQLRGRGGAGDEMEK